MVLLCHIEAMEDAKLSMAEGEATAPTQYCQFTGGRSASMKLGETLHLQEYFELPDEIV